MPTVSRVLLPLRLPGVPVVRLVPGVRLVLSVAPACSLQGPQFSSASIVRYVFEFFTVLVLVWVFVLVFFLVPFNSQELICASE